MKPLLIEGALVIGMKSPIDLTPNGKVYVEGGVIKALHDKALDEVAAAKARGEEVERFDAHGLWLLPGFVQTHIHLCQTLLRNGPDDLDLLPWLKSHVWPGEAAHDEETLELSARLGLAELAAGGTTSLLDMGTLRHTDAIFPAAKASGLRVTSGNVLMDDPDTSPPELFQTAVEGLAESERLIGKWHTSASGRLRFAYSPRFAVSSTDATLKEVATRARSRRLMVQTHASESLGEIELVRQRTGRSTVQYLHNVGIAGPHVVLAHVVHTEPAERDLLADDGTFVAHCPSSNLKLGSGICPVPEYLALGIRVTLGADGAPCNDRLDPFTEMRLAALLPKIRSGPAALTAYQVVRMATVEGARALGLAGLIGTIEFGKQADLVLLDPAAGFALPTSWRPDPFGPIVYSFDRSHVVATWVDGVLCYHRNGGGTATPPAPSEIENAVRRLKTNKDRKKPRRK